MNHPNTEVNDIIRLGRFVEGRVRPVRFSVESVRDKQKIIDMFVVHQLIYVEIYTSRVI